MHVYLQMAGMAKYTSIHAFISSLVCSFDLMTFLLKWAETYAKTWVTENSDATGRIEWFTKEEM